MRIKDAHGGEREYDSEKLRRSIRQAGFGPEAARKIEAEVRERLWEGITTTKIHSMVYEEMRKRREHFALRYRLREAIANLNPRYHEFEKYVARVLAMEGFDTEWSPRPLPQGECIEHEIDVVARRDDVTYLVECKHHFHHHRFTGLDVPMRQWARLQDLKKGHELGLKNAMEADRGWVIVNTKLSRHAKDYAECAGVDMTGWKYPEGNGLDAMVERNRAYPITILRPPHHVKKELSKRNILTLQELVELEGERRRDLGLDEEVLERTQSRAREMIEN